MSTINTYDLGDVVRCSTARLPFTNTAGNAIDPAAVFFQVKNPSGEVTLYEYGTDAEVVKTAVGVYHVDVDADQSGTWHYRFHSTGSGQAAAEGSFVVSPSKFT